MANQYSDGKPYHDKDTLGGLYHGEQMTAAEIGEKFGVTQATITRWLKKNGIETRTSQESRELRGTQYTPDPEGPHGDPEWLREKYIGEGMTLTEMAEEAGVAHESVIIHHMDKHGIERRTAGDYLRKDPGVKNAKHDNHDQIRFGVNGTTHYYDIHRIVAIGEFGLDAVGGSIVHHKNGIPWDNRPGNLELIDSQSEHAKMHAEERERDDNGRFV